MFTEYFCAKNSIQQAPTNKQLSSMLYTIIIDY